VFRSPGVSATGWPGLVGGPGAATGYRFEALATAFDTLDGSDAFVHPDAMAAVAASGKAAEVAALAAVAEEVGHSVDELPGHEHAHPLFTRLAAAWAGEPPEVAARGVADDVALIHVASMSNSSPHSGGPWSTSSSTRSRRPRGRGGPGGVRGLRLESIRLAQRSIMSRYVLEPVDLDVGDAVHRSHPV